jgi:midasin
MGEQPYALENNANIYFQENTNSDEKPTNIEDVIKSLKQFIEHSTLGDFHTRLDMLLGYHCHLVSMTTCEEKLDNETGSRTVVAMKTRTETRTLKNVLWNMYQFYSRFKGSVQAELDRLRSPIEKELKVSFHAGYLKRLVDILEKVLKFNLNLFT